MFINTVTTFGQVNTALRLVMLLEACAATVVKPGNPPTAYTELLYMCWDG